MKILTTDQIREADAHTIKNEPIKSIELMERASGAFVESYLNLPVGQSAVTIICGPGNNGGDGLAIARLLAQKNFEVEVWLIKLSANLSEDCETNLQRWRALGPLVEITSIEQMEHLKPGPVIIDALFGSGISRAITGLPARVIKYINQSGSLVVAVDMPSGLFTNQVNQGGEVIEADFTLSFQVPKLAFFLPQNHQYVGSWKILDIGLSQEFLHDVNTDWHSIDLELLRGFNREQHSFAHKGNFGHALLVTGAKGKIGASILCAKAALRGGLGLLTMHIPGCGYLPLQTAVPEAMCQLDQDEEICTKVVVSGNITALGIGPGLGLNPATIKSFEKLLRQLAFPIVIDADALNILGKHRELLELLPARSILTPHPKEFQRLTEKPQDDYHRLQLQSEFAGRHNVTLVYKGAATTVALPDGTLYFNTTGNPGMATGGSGDVLTGLITGLLTRTGDPLLAALAGVYIHGMAGDLAANKLSKISMTAGDIIDHIGAAIKKTNLLL